MRTDTHAFKGYDVVENARGNLSVMIPYLNHKGLRKYRPEGDFANRRELADYCHKHMMDWQRGKVAAPRALSEIAAQGDVPW